MLNTKCPYCNHPEMPEPPDVPRPFGKCPACGKKSLAVIEWIDEGEARQVHYVRTAHGQGKTVIVPFRPTPDNWERLKGERNRSEAINMALTMYYGAV